ncbi:hypothetical protein DFA_04929 [Cavenderia fasciculata]|uniref:Uncharacterized protein n=1 Tax=Cavenderia fasciculata TaxID=261658 RepID=F4PME9_CACFS|nr:uncharacterized protein DFA_04929 [Cavenderia fasciculata]EGG22799.1 hypothetical protein DFA_04929 [Cavenderia fasciculata]|eukprot:XP_004360650.1 hypothetical protein DFA_04929 [Cavenderia fasciculata]
MYISSTRPHSNAPLAPTIWTLVYLCSGSRTECFQQKVHCCNVEGVELTLLIDTIISIKSIKIIKNTIRTEHT